MYFFGFSDLVPLLSEYDSSELTFLYQIYTNNSSSEEEKYKLLRTIRIIKKKISDNEKNKKSKDSIFFDALTNLINAKDREPPMNVIYDKEKGVKKITSKCVDEAQITKTYILQDKSNYKKLININNHKLINKQNLGITILMINVDKICSEQYPVFMNNFKYISEIRFIEWTRIISNKFKHIPKNLSIHSKYGLLANKLIYLKEKKYITLYEYCSIIGMMTLNSFNLDYLTDIFKNFHYKIIQSFYILLSLENDKKTIEQVNELSQNFDLFIPRENFVLTESYKDAIYWFHVPNTAVWFVYTKGKFHTHGKFLSRDHYDLFHKLNGINSENAIFKGFVNEYKLHLVKVDCITTDGGRDWNASIDIVRNTLKEDCALKTINDLPQKISKKFLTNFYFVKSFDKQIYKLLF
ncbi:unknown [Gryllus bimaculatus nudivirus]|uniref:Uncharacterized protein n=1 Tax=Gryllus bimaculatus nudivirus TaxID=432587 RepID=A4L1Z6_9VIRU|nr:hypothetical protein GrBNV_gp33 [Gryllus bimaculatus nudivirus]ABO45366.1 unknown [Gryllus bimaculatus nudivirus]